MLRQPLVKTLALMALAALLVGACVAVPAPAPTLPASGPQNQPAEGPDADAAAELAKQTLLTQLGVLALDVEVVSIEETQWLDTALGCPAPDKVYLQVIVPGYRVVVRVSGADYDVHVGGENAVVCSPEGTPMEWHMAEPGLEPQVIVDAVKADLAQRLPVSLEQIEVVAVEAVQWRSSGLGCEQPGQMYLTVIVPGHRVVLKVGDTTYEYHTGDGRMVLCSTAAAE